MCGLCVYPGLVSPHDPGGAQASADGLELARDSLDLVAEFLLDLLLRQLADVAVSQRAVLAPVHVPDNR